MSTEMPVYSHNPYHTTKFPLLVLNVNYRTCTPSSEGFQVLHWQDDVEVIINNPIFTHYLLRSNVPKHNSILNNISLLDKLYSQENKYKYYEYGY